MSSRPLLAWAGALCLLAAASAPARSAEQGAAAYLGVMGWYKDAAAQREYTRVTADILRKHGYQGAIIGTPGLNLRVLEGNWTPRLLILASFPADKDVKRFWWSDDYRAARKIRLEQAHLDVAGIDGVPGVMPSRSPKSAHLVFFMKITDRAGFLKDYAPFAPSVVERHAGKFIIRTGREDIDALEGDWQNAGMVVVEFPDVERLRAFWTSDDYRKLSQVRKTTGDWSVVEIVPAP